MEDNLLLVGAKPKASARHLRCFNFGSGFLAMVKHRMHPSAQLCSLPLISQENGSLGSTQAARRDKSKARQKMVAQVQGGPKYMQMCLVCSKEVLRAKNREQAQFARKSSATMINNYSTRKHRTAASWTNRK